MLGRRLSFLVAGVVGGAFLTPASAPSPLYPVYQRLFDFSSFTLTVIFAVYVFALLAALLTVGSISDRVGRRPVASIALVLLALGMLLFAHADGVGDLLAARIVQGLAVGAAAGTTTAMIIDAASSPRLGSAISSAAPPLGIGSGAVLAGALVEYAPMPRQLVFWLLAAVYVVLAALVWLVPERAATRDSDGTSIWRTLKPSVALPSSTRPVFLALVPAMAATWALGGLYLSLGSSVLGTVLDVRSHFSVGLVLGIFFGSGAVGAAVSTILPERRREVLGYSALGLGIALTVAATVTSLLPLYALGSLVAGLGFGASFSFVVGELGRAAPAEQRGEVFATMYIVSYLAFSLPALAAGLAAGPFGLERTAVVYGVIDLLLVGVAAAAGIARARQGDDDLAAAGESA